MSNTENDSVEHGGAIDHVTLVGYLDDETTSDINSNLDAPYSLVRDVSSGGVHMVVWPEDRESDQHE